MAEHDLTDPDDRPDRFARLNTRWVRLGGALLVVLLAAVVAPTLTSGPNRDKAAVETANERRSSDSTVGLDDAPVDASVETPADETDDTEPAGADDPAALGGATTTSSPASSGTGGSVTTATTAIDGSGATTTTTVRVATTTTAAPATCTGGGAAELACRFDNYRAQLGLPAMRTTPAMQQRAQAWAEQQASVLRHSHSDLNGIFQACGGCTAVAENVGYNSTAAGAWQAWLNSTTHHDNIKTPKGGVYGMGAARGSDGYLYVVQMFGFT